MRLKWKTVVYATKIKGNAHICVKVKESHKYEDGSQIGILNKVKNYYEV